jgi:hypothetical protein
MKKGKAIGSHGFIINFFWNMWATVKNGLWEVVDESRISGRIPGSLKSTILALIPPKKTSQNINHF